MAVDQRDALLARFEAARRDREPLLDRTRLSSEIAAAGLDAVVAASRPNVVYTAAALLAFDTAPTFVVTTASGEQAVVVNDVDAGFVERYSPIERVIRYSYGAGSRAASVETLGDVLDELGLGRGAVGTELAAIGPDGLQALSKRLPALAWHEAREVFERVRLVKTPGEVELLRAAAQATLTAIADALGESEDQPTERGLAAAIQCNALRAGADDLGHTLVNAGENSTLVHSIAFERQMRPGEVLHVDVGARFAGYTSDVARNAVLGEPSPRQVDVQSRLRDAYEAVVASIGPGQRGSEIYERTRAELARVGLPCEWQSVGHSVGLSLHEGLDLGPTEETRLLPGMVICVEPSVVVAGDARYDLEDMLLVTSSGVERLSSGLDGLNRIGR